MVLACVPSVPLADHIDAGDHPLGAAQRSSLLQKVAGASRHRVPYSQQDELASAGRLARRVLGAQRQRAPGAEPVTVEESGAPRRTALKIKRRETSSVEQMQEELEEDDVGYFVQSRVLLRSHTRSSEEL